MLRIEPFIYHSVDEIIANTYLVYEDDKCFIIDPSVDNDNLINYLINHHLNLEAVLITHSHFDHIAGLKRLYDKFHMPIYIGYEDVLGLSDPYKNCSQDYSNSGISLDVKVTPVGDNEIIKLFNHEIKVIYTPYHTIGSVCYYVKDIDSIFTGDSLFNYAFGRSDLPTSVPAKIKESIEKLMKLDDNVKVYPGHGRFTTIGIEKKFIYHHANFF